MRMIIRTFAVLFILRGISIADIMPLRVNCCKQVLALIDGQRSILPVLA